ncbi:DUF6093 family protein [Streptomyces sp. NPDC001828]|uniref:DUF6093 family protein n=1 Tax=Streptomyces sp. NPDC001828 TaxID=3364615 RepID=UPI0036C1EB06
MPFDIAAKRAELEAWLTDTVRITRNAEPSVVYEGPGALLSTHGQIVFAQMVGLDWAGESTAWYQLLTPLTAPAAEPGDRVEVVASKDPNSVVAGRTWYCEARTQGSTWEVVRVTRLDEQGGGVGAL